MEHYLGFIFTKQNLSLQEILNVIGLKVVYNVQKFVGKQLSRSSKNNY